MGHGDPDPGPAKDRNLPFIDAATMVASNSEESIRIPQEIKSGGAVLLSTTPPLSYLTRVLILSPKPESLRCETIDQDTGHNGINHTEGNTRHTEHQNRQPEVHHGIAYHIGEDHHDAIGPALHLCSSCIGLKQVVDGQVMDGEKGAHSEDRDHQHHIVEGVVCPAGDIEDQCEAESNHQRRNCIDLHDFPQADLKQLEHKPRALIE